MSERRCTFHDSPWPEGEMWCQLILDRWHIDMDLDLTDCTLDDGEGEA